MNKLILTVAIPTFNGGDSLIEAIESCRNINFAEDEFEVLIVDNCSDDNSIQAIQEKFKYFKPIRIIKNSINCGRINNWNKCLEFAQGEFILFLFANDLIAKENYIHESIGMLQHNQQCSIVSAPWIFSDYEMSKMHIEPQFFKRTPGFGYFEAEPHIKSIVESGKLPFVCLQSTILRRSLIHDASLVFDPEIPLTCDGVFLSELALQTNWVAFFDKPAIIFRHDAPNRQHANVKLHEHVKQMFDAFVKISNLIKNKRTNLYLAFSNYKGLESLLDNIFRSRSWRDLKYSKQIISSWWSSVRKYKINIGILLLLLIIRMGMLPVKLFSYLKNKKIILISFNYFDWI